MFSESNISSSARRSAVVLRPVIIQRANEVKLSIFVLSKMYSVNIE